MDKKSVRSAALAQLKKRAVSGRFARSAKVRKELERLVGRLRPKTVLAYLPLEFEADIRPLFRPWRSTSKLYVPFMEGVSFKMVRYRLPLKRQRLGILAPTDSRQKIKKVDVMIVPTLAVDAAFKRIGFGKGMYDRFYPTLQNKPIVIFVQPVSIRADRTVSDEWDLRGDFLVSDQGTIQSRGILHDNRNTRYRSRHR